MKSDIEGQINRKTYTILFDPNFFNRFFTNFFQLFFDNCTKFFRLIINPSTSTCSGVFTVTPVKGEALSTKFVMSATEGWSDPEGAQVKFQFAYRMKEDANEEGSYFVYALQQDNSFTTMLPSGKHFLNSSRPGVLNKIRENEPASYLNSCIA